MLLRAATNEEIKMIRATWQRGFHVNHLARDPVGNPAVRAGKMWLSPKIWGPMARSAVKDIITRKGVKLEVIDEEGMVMAWSAWEWDTEHQRALIHYVYVVPTARRCGLGSKLLQPLMSTKYLFTMMTADGSKLAETCERRRAA